MSGVGRNQNTIESAPWRDEDTLRELYSEQGLSEADVGDELGCSSTTIHNWLEKHGIKRRTPLKQRPPHYGMLPGGYMRWMTLVGDRTYVVQIHRLLAVSKYGFQRVTSEMDVHHINGVPWDNREDNIELINHREHARKHAVENKAERHFPDWNRLERDEDGSFAGLKNDPEAAVDLMEAR